MWALIYIQLVFPTSGLSDVDATWYGTYSDIDKCFMAREMLLLDQGHTDLYPEANTQIVCVRIDKDK